MTVRRHHLAATEPPHLALSSAIDRCAQLLHEHATRELALALATKDQLAGPLAEVLGAEAVRALDRDNVYLRKGLVVHLLTLKIQRRRVQGPVLAVGMPAALLDRVVMAQGVTDVVFVPDSDEDLGDYLALFPASEEIVLSGDAQAGCSDASQRQASVAPQGLR